MIGGSVSSCFAIDPKTSHLHARIPGGYRGGIRSPKWGYRMALTDLAIRRTKARERAYKLYDEKGLYLLISPTGAKRSRRSTRQNSWMRSV